MANLDTRSKRASSVQFMAPYIGSLVLPDGTIGQGDRQHTAWSYSGILATAAVVGSGEAEICARLWVGPMIDATMEVTPMIAVKMDVNPMIDAVVSDGCC